MLHWLAGTDGERGEFIKRNGHPSGGNCFVLTTPAGQKLAGSNGPGGAAQALKEGLARWHALPEAQRKALPPAPPAGAAPPPPELARVTPPPGGLILSCYIRNLKRDAAGELAAISPYDLNDRSAYPDQHPIYTEPAPYTVWLTEPEWRSLIPPSSAQPGDRFPGPDAIEKRLFRYHLVNGTFGLPG